MPTKRPGQQISTTLGVSMLLGLTAWLLLLASAGAKVHQEHTEVFFGPLLLHVVKRHEGADGLAVSLSFENGFWAYVGMCLAIGVAAGFLLGAARKRLRAREIKSAGERVGLDR